jgi:hypothetical protein
MQIYSILKEKLAVGNRLTIKGRSINPFLSRNKFTVEPRGSRVIKQIILTFECAIYLNDDKTKKHTPVFSGGSCVKHSCLFTIN